MPSQNPQTPLRFCALVFLVSRFFFAFWVYFGHLNHPFQEKLPGSFEGVSNWWLNPWTLYDSVYFLSIARVGYEPISTPFFPLYPFLMRVFGSNENVLAFGGILISNLAFFVALILLWKLAESRFDAPTARRSVWLLAFFPCAAYGSAVYTESLFLALSLAFFWFATQKQWALCALFGALAALTRNAGPLLFLALLLNGFNLEKRRFSLPIGAVLASLAPLLAFVGFQLALKNQFGALASIEAQKTFGRAAMWPWIPLWLDFQNILSGKSLDPVTISNWLTTVGAFGLIWKFRRQMPLGELLLLGGALMLNLILARTWPPYITSALRYAFGMFPTAILLALWSLNATKSASSPQMARVFSLGLGFLYLTWGAVISFGFGLKNFIG